MTISFEDLSDLVRGTLAEYDRPKMSQVAQTLQRHPGYDDFVKPGKLQKSGKEIRFQLLVDKADSSRNVGLYEEDDYSVGTYTEDVVFPWAHRTQNWAVDTKEIDVNQGAARIFDIMKTKEAACLIDMVEKHEVELWGKPTSSTEKNKGYGIECFIVSDSTSAGAFVGGAPSGFASGIGGLVHDKWRNWAAGYAALTKDDAIRKMRKAYRECGWVSPITLSDFRKGSQYKIYINGDTADLLSEMLQAQNDNLGTDVAAMDEQMTFKKIGFKYASELDNKTDSPIYMIDCNAIHMVFLGKNKMRRSSPTRHPRMHDTVVVHIDSSYQLVCNNRRTSAVLTDSTA